MPTVVVSEILWGEKPHKTNKQTKTITQNSQTKMLDSVINLTKSSAVLSLWTDKRSYSHLP